MTVSLEVSRARLGRAPTALTARAVNHASQVVAAGDRGRRALRRATPADLVCLGGTGLSLTIGYLTIPLVPFLLRHVLTHLLVTGSITALLAGGSAAHAGHGSLLLAAAAGVVGNAGFDGFYFWAGRRYGGSIATAVGRFGIGPATVARTEGWVRRHARPLLIASPFLPVPTALVILLAGASEVRWRWFVLCDVVGWYVWCLLFVGLGWVFHDEVSGVVAAVGRYSKIAVVVGILALVASLLAGRRRRPQRP